METKKETKKAKKETKQNAKKELKHFDCLKLIAFSVNIPRSYSKKVNELSLLLNNDITLLSGRKFAVVLTAIKNKHGITLSTPFINDLIKDANNLNRNNKVSKILSQADLKTDEKQNRYFEGYNELGILEKQRENTRFIIA